MAPKTSALNSAAHRSAGWASAVIEARKPPGVPPFITTLKT
jgi:hypothetical protein